MQQHQHRSGAELRTRVLRDDEIREANALFRHSLHMAAPNDEEWAQERLTFQPERTYGAFDRELVGTTRSVDAELVVPGGAPVSLEAVTGVGVRADRTRKGVLTELMRAQLAGFAARGTTAASLYATEGGIYGRFGYGVATVTRSCSVDRHHARLRADVPVGGAIELLDVDEAFQRLPGIYAALSGRAGMMSRPAHWWNKIFTRRRRGSGPLVTVVHHGLQGPDGFVQYRVEKESGQAGTLHVLDLHAGTAEAFAGMWRFLLSVDLVDRIEAPARPLDEPLELLFTDPRMCRVTGLQDETWVRLVDVATALRSRAYGSEAIVLAVTDPVLETNTGHYLVSADGVWRTDDRAELRLEVDALGMVFFGMWQPSALVQVGRGSATSQEAATRADRLFSTPKQAWCGTFF